MLDPRSWNERPFQIESHQGIDVIRDDLLEGGSKTRFLPFLIRPGAELVFGGPFCGGAPLALSIIGRETGQRVTLFYAARADLHRRQKQALANGARIIACRPGYMTVVQKRARDYAAKYGAQFLPLGFDLPEAEEPFVNAMERVRRERGQPDQIWCAAGSGMLARCLGRAFPSSEICAVAVGLASRHDAQSMPPNVSILSQPLKFEQESKAAAPFPSCPNYDRKAWERCAKERRGSAIFWNVLA